MYEIYVLTNSRLYLRIINNINDRKERKERGEEVEPTPKQWHLLTEDQKTTSRIAVFSFFYFLWLIIGAIFSSYWYVFVGIILLGYTFSYYRKRMLKYRSRASINLIRLDALVSLLAIAFLILNHFHKLL